MIHATIPPVISLFHDSTPPIGKCVLRRNGMYDDLDTNWGEFAIKNPLNPARRKHRTRSDHCILAATRQRGNGAVTKSRLGLWPLDCCGGRAAHPGWRDGEPVNANDLALSHSDGTGALSRCGPFQLLAPGPLGRLASSSSNIGWAGGRQKDSAISRERRFHNRGLSSGAAHAAGSAPPGVSR